MNSVLLGKWKKPFDPQYTRKADFHVDENTKVSVDMMARSGHFSLYFDWKNFTSIILLPYGGNTYMMIVLPDEGKMQEVEKNISKDQLNYWHDRLYSG